MPYFLPNDNFHYRDNRLYCDEVPLSEIAKQAGTPVYVYSAARIRQNVTRLQAAFAERSPIIHYSLKANANLAIIKLLAGLGLGMDAVSGGEIYRAAAARVEPSKIVFAGAGKTREELRYALEVGVGWFNVEGAQELVLLNQLAEDTRPNVALRLNPDVAAQTHHHIATGHGQTKFGMSAAVIGQILSHLHEYPNINIAGIHVHIGSQLGDVRQTVEAVQLAQSLAAPYPQIRTLNIGGGFPVPYTPDDEYPSPETFAQALAPLLDGWQLKLEPGRFIVADAGALLVQTIYTKIQGGKHFAITDGSMSELLRPALYDAVHPVVPLVQSDTPTQATIITGPVCETADVLHKNADLPALEPDDYLAVLVAGAYGHVMASNYNQRPRPPEVLVEESQWRVIRRRETWEDLLYLER